MTNGEKVIRTTAKMYETRDMLRTLWGAEYAERIAPVKEIVVAVAKANKLSTLSAAIKVMTESSVMGAMVVPSVTAAAVELIEAERAAPRD